MGEENEVERVGLNQFSIRYLVKTSYCTVFMPSPNTTKTTTIIIYPKEIKVKNDNGETTLSFKFDCSMSQACLNMSCAFVREKRLVESLKTLNQP